MNNQEKAEQFLAPVKAAFAQELDARDAAIAEKDQEIASLKEQISNPAPQPQPEPTPEPTPVPVPTPIPGGAVPALLQRVRLVDGFFVSNPDWHVRIGNLATIAAVQFLLSPDHNDELTMEYDLAMRAVYDQAVNNLKWWRMWAAKANVYEGQPGPNDVFRFAEYITHVPIVGRSAWQTSHRSIDPAWRKKIFDGQVHRWKRYIKFPSAVGKNDGVYQVWLDGVEMLGDDKFQCDDAALPGCPTQFYIQLNPSGHDQPASSFFKLKDSVKISLVKK